LRGPFVSRLFDDDARRHAKRIPRLANGVCLDDGNVVRVPHARNGVALTFSHFDQHCVGARVVFDESNGAALLCGECLIVQNVHCLASLDFDCDDGRSVNVRRAP